jgi:hypothetical protein
MQPASGVRTVVAARRLAAALVLAAGLVGLSGCPRFGPKVAPDTAEVAAKGDTAKGDTNTKKNNKTGKTNKTGPAETGKGDAAKGDGGKDTGKGDGDGGKGGDKGGPQPAVKWTLHETVLLTPEQARAADPAGYRLAPDCRRWVCLLHRYGGFTPIIDGVEEPYTGYDMPVFHFSRDSKHTAYYLRAGWPADHLVWDGKKVAGSDTLLAFCEGGLVSALYGQATGTGGEVPAELFVNGTKATVLPGVDDPAKVGAFNTAGGRLRWAISDPDGVLVDGQRVSKTPAAAVSELQFSGDGSTYAFLATEGDGANKQMVAYVNGERHKPYPAIKGLTLSGNGKAVGYLVTVEGGKTYAVITGTKPVEAANESTINFSPDGTRWAVVPGLKGAVLVDGKAESLVNNDKHWTNVVWPGPRYSSGPRLAAPSFAFSPDGKHYAYAICEEVREAEDRYTTSYRVVRDGKPGKAWAGICPGVAWSPDSQSLVYFAREKSDGPWTLVRDDKALPPCEVWATEGEGKRDEVKTVAVRFSPNGKHVAYAGRQGLSWVVWIDGQEVAAYDKVFVDRAGFGFTPEGRLAFLAQKDNESVCHAELTPPGLQRSAGPKKLQPSPGKDGWVYLFNGMDFRRWAACQPSHEAGQDRSGVWDITDYWYFGVKDGAIVSVRRPEGWMGGLRTGGGAFKDFHLRVECKIDDHAAALYFRGGHVAIFNNRAAKSGLTGSFYIVGSQKPEADVAPSPVRDGEWFTLDLLVERKRVQVRIDGKVTADLEMNDRAFASGPIVLYHGADCRMQWRNLQIREYVEPAEWNKGKR